MKQRETVTVSDRAGSREAVERAIEKSKEGSGARWEKPSQTPRWGQKREDRRTAPATIERRT